MEKKKFRGNHWIVQFNECSRLSSLGKIVIDEPEELKKILIDAANMVKAKVLNAFSYQFSPQGVTALVAISESHLSIHTWPENKDAEFDFNTCNPKMDGNSLIKFIAEKIGSKKYFIRKIIRNTNGSKVETEVIKVDN